MLSLLQGYLFKCRKYFPIGGESMPKCSVCREEFQESQLLHCYDCGKAYCLKCAEKDPNLKELGICPDCEEVFADEEDE
jgi:hypothetical protein